MSISIGVINTLKAATEVVEKLDAKNLRELRREIDAKIAEDDARNGAKAKRMARLEAAMTNESMTPAVRYLVGRLRSIGLDLRDVTFATLNEKLSAAAVDPTTRQAIKNVAYACGLID